MEEINISQNITSIVDAKKIIEAISSMNNRYETSKKEAENLILDLSDSSSQIQKANDDTSIARRIGGFSSETLLNLITGSSNAAQTSVTSISKLIKNTNENTKILAELIGKLAMLSGLSFEKISQTTAELEVLANNLVASSGGDSEQASQIKRIILAHINKIKEDKNKSDKIEFNFKIIDNKLIELTDKLNITSLENENKIKLIHNLLNSKSEEDFVKILKKQKKIINGLIVFTTCMFLIILVFILYYFQYSTS